MSKKRLRSSDIETILNDIERGYIADDCQWYQFSPQTKFDEPGQEPCIDYNYHFFKYMNQLPEDHPLHNPKLRYDRDMLDYVDEAWEYLDYASEEEIAEFICRYDQFASKVQTLTKMIKKYHHED